MISDEAVRAVLGALLDVRPRRPAPLSMMTPEDIDAQIVRTRFRSALTPEDRKRLLVELEGGQKYRLRPEDKERFVTELLRKGVAA